MLFLQVKVMNLFVVDSLNFDLDICGSPLLQVSQQAHQEKVNCAPRGTPVKKNNERNMDVRDKRTWDHAARLCLSQESLGGNLYFDAPSVDRRLNQAYSKVTYELMSTTNYCT